MGIAADDAIRWSGRTVLVTGAAGLLGRAVARRLADAGADIIGLDVAWRELQQPTIHPVVRRVDGDIRNTYLVNQLLVDDRVDTVIHLAAQTQVGVALIDPVGTFSNNIEGTWSVLEACRTAIAVTGIVVASSDKAYGDWGGRPYREGMATRARHPYDVSKAATDLIAQSYAATYALPVAVTRCGNLYGGGDLNWDRLIPGTVRAVLAGQSPIVRSDGSFVRDYLHVADAVGGVLLLAGAVRDRADIRGEAFNFASGVRLAVIDMVRRILTLMGSTLEPTILGLDLNEIAEQRVSAARARRVLGWRPKMTLDEGLREAIAWYRTYLDRAA